MQDADVSAEGAAANATINATANGTATNGTDAKNATATTIKRIQVPKKKVAKVALKVEAAWAKPGTEGTPVVAEARKRMASWVAAEAEKRAIAKARNDLESYVIATKEALETDEAIAKVRRGTAWLAGWAGGRG